MKKAFLTSNKTSISLLAAILSFKSPKSDNSQKTTVYIQKGKGQEDRHHVASHGTSSWIDEELKICSQLQQLPIDL